MWFLCSLWIHHIEFLSPQNLRSCFYSEELSAIFEPKQCIVKPVFLAPGWHSHHWALSFVFLVDSRFHCQLLLLCFSLINLHPSSWALWPLAVPILKQKCNRGSCWFSDWKPGNSAAILEVETLIKYYQKCTGKENCSSSRPFTQWNRFLPDFWLEEGIGVEETFYFSLYAFYFQYFDTTRNPHFYEQNPNKNIKIVTLKAINTIKISHPKWIDNTE